MSLNGVDADDIEGREMSALSTAKAITVRPWSRAILINSATSDSLTAPAARAWISAGLAKLDVGERLGMFLQQRRIGEPDLFQQQAISVLLERSL